MSKSMPDSQTSENQNLSNALFSHLDEKLFFPRLCDHLHKLIAADCTRIFIVNQDQSASLISKDGKLSKSNTQLDKGEGPAGHVIRTKRPYFSNSTTRDPLFSVEASEGVQKEMITPILYEGIVIATIHFQILSGDFEFTQEHINTVMELLKSIKKPIANIKMYLAAKFLNEALVKQIESKERELKESKNGLNVSDTYKISDTEIIGKSAAMKEILKVAEKVSKSDSNALLEGSTGTGKEMIGRKIHCLNKRAENPFFSVDASAVSEMQLEKEIFGEDTTDFTRGPLANAGVLEKANGGTLFINNIDRMSLGTQTRLSKYIAEGLAFRVNGQVPYRTDVKIIGATTKNLRDMVSENLFREDLFFELAAITLRVPALHERGEDIELLANYFLNKGKPCDQHKSISPSALKILMEYSWPGNVRELHNVMERAFILSDGIVIEKDHLSDNISTTEHVIPEEKRAVDYTEMTLDELEKIHITSTLDHLGGNKTRTAKTLGITVKTLYNKLHSYGMIASKEA